MKYTIFCIFRLKTFFPRRRCSLMLVKWWWPFSVDGMEVETIWVILNYSYLLEVHQSHHRNNVLELVVILLSLAKIVPYNVLRVLEMLNFYEMPYWVGPPIMTAQLQWLVDQLGRMQLCEHCFKPVINFWCQFIPNIGEVKADWWLCEGRFLRDCNGPLLWFP